MAETTRQLILAAFLAAVREITIANGFATDAGNTVYIGETAQLGDDDPDQAIALVVDDDDARSPGYVFVTLPIVVQALAKADLDEPWLVVESLLGDLKRAIETEDRTLGGLLKSELQRGSTRTLAREPGSTTVGAAITYRCEYVEVWGNP